MNGVERSSPVTLARRGRIGAVAFASILAVPCLLPLPAAAQLGNASTAAMGVAGAVTGNARELAAISQNPAGLGMPGSGFSLSILPFRVRSGLEPVTLADLADFGGRLIPATTKEEWLDLVDEADGETGRTGVEVNELALTFWNVGFQVTTLVSTTMSLSPDVVEAVLYGNAGRTGEPTDLSLGGSRMEGYAVTTAAGSFALPLPVISGQMAIGATLKYSVGHAVAAAEEQGGLVQADPLRVEVDFPIVHTSERRFDDEELNNGSGIGLDLGAQWRGDRVSIGVAVQNVLNTFEWDETTLAFRPGTALLEEGTSETSFDTVSVSLAPQSVLEVVREMKFVPIVAVGAAYDGHPDLTLSADVKTRLGDGFDVGPKLRAGVGAEYRGLRILHLRGGAALITDGFELSGGGSLVLGPVSLSVAAAIQGGSADDATIAQLGLSFGGR